MGAAERKREKENSERSRALWPSFGRVLRRANGHACRSEPDDCTRRAFFWFLFVRGVGPRSSSKTKHRSVSKWRDMPSASDRATNRETISHQHTRNSLRKYRSQPHPSPALPLRKQFPGDTCRQREPHMEVPLLLFFLFIFHDARLYVPHREVHCAPQICTCIRPQVTCIAMAVFDTL